MVWYVKEYWNSTGQLGTVCSTYVWCETVQLGCDGAAVNGAVMRWVSYDGALIVCRISRTLRM